MNRTDGGPNPYATPQSALDVDGGHADLKIVSLKGRIGRLRYLVYSMLAMLLVGVVVALLAGLLGAFGNAHLWFGRGGVPTFMLVVLALLMFLPAIVLAVRRLNDFNASGLLVLLMFVPLVNMILTLLLLLMPGTAGANRYGLPPPPNSTAVKIGAWIIIGMYALGVIGGLLAPQGPPYG